MDGRGGNDRLYGGIGDDWLHGGTGNDLVAGGHGADHLYGDKGSDWTRGDGTHDHLIEEENPDPGDRDVVSFATGVTPGFGGNGPGLANFPDPSGERGLYLRKTAGSGENPTADNGETGDGGGIDTRAGDTDLSRFEVIVGTPFADRIVGSDQAETIYGGGGTDVIEGLGGDDILNGGAGGDHIDGGSGTNMINADNGIDYCTNGSTMDSCNEFLSGPSGVVPRANSKVAVGFNSEVTGASSDNKFLQLFVKGSTTADNISVKYLTAGSYKKVVFTLTSGSFDQSPTERTAGCNYSEITASPPKVTCTFLNATGNPNNRYLDSIVMAGLGGSDTLNINNFGIPRSTLVMMLGGAGNDHIYGAEWYDQLVDGPGNDVLYAYEGDDGLINGLGADTLYAGDGDDLLLSTEICDAPDYLGGGGGTMDNSSWFQARDRLLGVGADLDLGTFGEFDPGVGITTCSNPSNIGTLAGIENMEGTRYPDRLRGNSGDNNLMGWHGGDILDGREGEDLIAGFALGATPATFPNVSNPNASEMNKIYGRSGNDRIDVYNGLEDSLVDCGTGDEDRVKRDSIDEDVVNATGTCEKDEVGEWPR